MVVAAIGVLWIRIHFAVTLSVLLDVLEERATIAMYVSACDQCNYFLTTKVIWGWSLRTCTLLISKILPVVNLRVQCNILAKALHVDR